jgi:hypothetical protein
MKANSCNRQPPISQKRPRLRITLFIALLFLMAKLSTPSCAQAQPEIAVTGRVTDAATREPLVGANVFLASTTRGAITARDGHYFITNIPLGAYELVVSLMGYEAQKTVVKFSETKNRNFDFAMRPKVLTGEEVTVIGEVPKEWKNNLKIFERVFLGMKEFKPFANECKILNPEILDFTYDRAAGNFQAFARAPLHFVNHALGYEINFIVTQFNAHLVNDNIYSVQTVQAPGGYMGAEYKKGSLQCTGVVQYKPLAPSNDSEKEKWEKNRLITYNGCLRHFLKTLCEGRLKEEGFRIYGTTKFMEKYDYSVKADTLLKPDVLPSQRILAFPNFLKVVYAKEKDEMQYQSNMQMLGQRIFSSDESRDEEIRNITAYFSKQISWLRISNGTGVVISTSGLKVPGGASLGAAGYWGLETASEWLPTDYTPLQVLN